ncbi:MAG: SurA N-terminal domain-containing protein [Thermacetogeniaceae bacterium]|nr:SurA N-terminal domain-containing protein [Thermoanaerobacterales bacterium]NLN21139.1 hypothetical protein [Syntrophomonadaceae bacterium]HAF17296.1 hypothetical protein [Peptococcaceae bacterium]
METAAKTRKIVSYLPQILVFILIIAVGGIWAWRVYSGDWIVQVNGIKISRAELDRETALAEKFFETYYGVDFQGDEGEALKKQLRQQTLFQLIDYALLHQAAVNCGLQVSEGEINQQLLLDQMQAGGAENFRQILKQEGMTEDQYRETLKKVMMIDKLQDYITKDVTVEEKLIQEAYQEYKDMLVMPERVKVGHILVETEEEARDLIAQLKQGTDFEKLAEQKSIDPSAKQNKGILGYIGKNDTGIAEEFKNAAFTLSPGEFSQEPVKTEFGYHVIWCFDKKDAGTATYEEVKDSLSQQLIAQKKQEKFSEYQEKLRMNSWLFWHPDYEV